MAPLGIGWGRAWTFWHCWRPALRHEGSPLVIVCSRCGARVDFDRYGAVAWRKPGERSDRILKDE